MKYFKRLKLIILKSGLSLPEFSKRVSVSRNTLISYRDGMTSPPVSFLERVCEEFDINPAWLILGIGDPERVQSKSKGAVSDLDPLEALADQIINEANLTLTPEAKREFMQVIDDETWRGFKAGYARLLKIMAEVKPWWISKDDPEKVEEIIMISVENCGDVTRLDLSVDDEKGRIDIKLDDIDIGRIIEAAFHELPEKTAYEKRCKGSVQAWFAKVKFNAVFQPTLDKNKLKTQGKLVI